MKRIGLYLFIIGIPFIKAYGQEDSGPVNTGAANYLTIPVDARSAAMGGAGWSVGIHASNLGPKIKYLTSKEALPAMVKVGGAADLPFASMHRLTLTADLGYRLSPDDVQALNVSAGAEYAWMEHLMLRGGYHYGDKNKGDASYATAGAGVEYAGVHLDFAWMFAGHECLARNTFWISLGYSF